MHHLKLGKGSGGESPLGSRNGKPASRRIDLNGLYARLCTRPLMILRCNILRAVFALGALVSLGGCDQDRGAPFGESVFDDNQLGRAIPVEVAPVRIGRVDAIYSTTATLSAEEEATIVAKSRGIVMEIRAEEGDQVEKHQILATIDTERLTLELQRSRVNLENLKRSFDRSQRLFESNMVSSDRHEQAKSAYDTAKADFELRDLQLREATIRAPFAGTITARHVKAGNTLNPGDAAFDIKRFRTLEAVLNVPERQLAHLDTGQDARVRIDALPEMRFTGHVKRISPVVDSGSGTFRVTVEVANDDRTLKPGMFARIEIRYDSHEEALLIRKDAVVTRNDQPAVFVVRDGVAHRQQVVIGYSSEDSVEILDGLAHGDRVVTTGQNSLKDETRVRVIGAQNDASG